jgi:two-component system chemotaxis response regulator CheY
MRSRIRRDLVDAGFEVVGEARDGLEAVSQYQKLRPDVVTMDLTMRGHDGIAGGTGILNVDPKARLVLFTIVTEPEVIEKAMQVGFAACAHKSTPGDLVARVRELAAQGMTAQ